MNSKNKKINMIKGCPFIPDNNFISEYYEYGSQDFGYDLILSISETDMIHTSSCIQAYNLDFKPYRRTNESKSNIHIVHHHIDEDGYIVIDKGVIGTDTTLFIVSLHVEELEEEFNITMNLLRDESIAQEVYKAYKNYDFDINDYLKQHTLNKLRTSNVPIRSLLEKLERTRFLDCSESDCVPVPVLYGANNNFYINGNMTNYRPTYNNVLEVGSQLSSQYPNSTVEVLEIVEFMHSIYGEFYAVCRVVQIYNIIGHTGFAQHEPAGVRANFNKLLEEAEYIDEVPFYGLPSSERIHMKLVISNRKFGVRLPDGYFALDVGLMRLGSGTDGLSNIYHCAMGDCFGALTRFDGMYKIYIYKIVGAVEFNGDYYVILDLVDSTFRFNKFPSHKEVLFMNALQINACRCAEYLMLTDNIEAIELR